MWMIRCEGGQLVEEFLDQGMVALGWRDTGSLEQLKSRDQIIGKVREVWPAYKPMKAVVSGSQLDKITNVMAAGDRIMTYDPSKRIYHLGRITGPYSFVGSDDEMTAHRRPVKWDAHIERDKLSVPTKNSLGSTLSVFNVSLPIEQEIDSLLSGKAPVDSVVEAEAATDTPSDTKYIFDDLKSQAKEFVKDRVIALDWDDMQELVAGVLRAMGYKTRISPQGSDRGKDIIASPDGLGLEQPRIVVEVKHRPGTQIGSQDVRSFLGGRHTDDKGLYVSTGGFSKDARYEADRANIPLTLMNIDDLVDLIIENYERMDMEARTLLPLAKLYWPS